MNLKRKLLSKIHKEFPQVKFKNAKLVTEGWDHDVLILDNKWIFRFAKNRQYKKNFAREVQFLKDFFKISNLQVPNYIFLSNDKTFGGYKIIRGRKLTRRIYKRLDFRRKQKIISDLAKFLNRLHSIPLKRAKRYGFKPYLAWTENPKWLKNEFIPKVGKHLTAKQNAFIKNFTLSFSKEQKPIKQALGHFDLGHDHILVNKDKHIAGIIDFGDMNISEPAREFNGFYDYDINLPKQIYKLYRGPKDSQFLKRARKHSIHTWIYLLYDSLVNRKDKALWKEAKAKINEIIKTYAD